MRIIRRLFGDIMGRPAVVGRSPDRAEQRGAPLEDEVRRLCAKGALDSMGAMLAARLTTPATLGEAQDLMRTVITPAIAACVDHGDSKTACDLESLVAYTRLVKAFEDPEHYEACFDMIDGAMHTLGLRDRAALNTVSTGPVDRLLFFAHNLGTDLAHLTLLCELIDAYLSKRPHEASRIGLVGITGELPSPRVRDLQSRWGISVWMFPEKYRFRDAYLGAARLLGLQGFDRLIVASVPTGLSYLSGLLPPRQLGWLTMKYELTCFSHLRHRCSFRSGVRRSRSVGKTVWHEAAPLFARCEALNPSPRPSQALRDARQFSTVFYTINREEKIRNPVYLERVARILAQVPDSVFVWTGRGRLLEIDEFFSSRGLDRRHIFAGWVFPDDLLSMGDIFLDTPVLSGNVAAQAIAVGVPVLTDGDAISWIATFLPAFEASRGSASLTGLTQEIDTLALGGILLQCRDGDQYVDQAVRLARNPALRKSYGKALQAFARQYFFNAQASAVDHFANLCAAVE